MYLMSYNRQYNYNKSPTMMGDFKLSERTMIDEPAQNIINWLYIPYDIIYYFNNELNDLVLNTWTENYFQNNNKGKYVLDTQYLTGSFDIDQVNDANISKTLSIRIRVYGNTWNVKFGNYEIMCNNQ